MQKLPVEHRDLPQLLISADSYILRHLVSGNGLNLPIVFVLRFESFLMTDVECFVVLWILQHVTFDLLNQFGCHPKVMSQQPENMV